MVAEKIFDSKRGEQRERGGGGGRGSDAYGETENLFSSSNVMSGNQWRNRYSDLLWAGRSGDRIPEGAKFFAPVQTGPRAHPASYTIAPGLLPGGKAAGVWR
jgi:hypothetical protein